MDLREFISTVLVELVRGVEVAQAQLSDSKATINPLGLKAEIALCENKETPQFTNVEFEVAVEVQSKGAHGGSFGVQMAVIKMGLDENTSKSEAQINRLRFSVPVHLPPGDILKLDQEA